MPSRDRTTGEKPAASQPFTSEQTDIYLQGQRLTAFVSDYIVEATPQKIRYQHGVEVQSITTSATSHKGPKETRTLRPNQYLVLVRYLISCGGLQVPRHVLQALKSLIRIRKVVCSWFQDAEDSRMIGDNERHQYFVEILELVSQMLSPYEVIEVETQTKLEAAKDEVEAITNVFAHLKDLDTDDDKDVGPRPSEEELQAKAESAVDVFSAENKTKSRRDIKRICDTNWILHQCFLLRDHIQQKWRDHREGRCDLATATVLTNTAVEIAERMQDVLLDKYMKEAGEVTIKVFYREHLLENAGGKQSSGTAKTNRRSTSNLPLFNFRAAWGLSESLFEKKHQHILEFYFGEKFQLGLKKLRRRDESGEFKDDMSKGIAAAQAFIQSLPWDQLRTQYPHHISGSLSTSTTMDPEEYGYRPELLKELEEVFDDNLRECTKEHPCHTSVEDYVLKILRREVAMGCSSLLGAFALTIFVDIREIMGVGSQQLMKVDRAAERLVKDSAATSKHALEVEGLTEPPRTASNGVELQFAENPFAWFGRSVLRGRKMGAQPDYLATQEAQFSMQGQIRRFLEQSPLACGQLELFLRYGRQTACTRSVDARETVKACLHFYNAAYQVGDIDTRWPDMERLIELHGCEALFLGPRPVTLEQCIDRWRRVFAINVDLKSVYPGRGKISSPEKRGLFANTLCPLMCLLGVVGVSNDRLGWRQTPFQDIELLLSFYQRHPDQAISITSGGSFRTSAEAAFQENKPLLERLAGGRKRLEPLDLLDILEQRLKVEETALDAFDYLHMEKLCWKMLSRIHYTFVAQRVDLEMGNSRELVHKTGRGQRGYALLSMPLLLLALTHDGVAKDVGNLLEKRVRPPGIRRLGASRDEGSDILAEIFLKHTGMSRKPFDTSAKLMRQHIRRHGNDVAGVDGGKNREARHWVAVGTGLMLHTSRHVSKATQRDELGTGRKCMMMLP